MKKEISPALIAGVVALSVVLLGAAYWFTVGRGEAGLPPAGAAGNQPPPIKGINPVRPNTAGPR